MKLSEFEEGVILHTKTIRYPFSLAELTCNQGKYTLTVIDGVTGGKLFVNTAAYENIVTFLKEEVNISESDNIWYPVESDINSDPVMINLLKMADNLHSLGDFADFMRTFTNYLISIAPAEKKQGVEKIWEKVRETMSKDQRED